jgi:D-alanyl-D-alanine carboxypeptidase
MKYTLSLFKAASLSLSLCACVPALHSDSPATARLARQVEEQAISSDAGIAVYVTGRGIPAFGEAAGVADPKTGRPMTVDTPVRTASNTKTFVAAAALRLWEDGKLNLDSPISGLLTPRLDQLLKSDGYQTDRITVRHLLSHSGGLYDHGGDSRYFKAILAAPGRVWTRQEQVALSMDYGDPQGAPGSAFRYSDTGYILLGDILERSTGEPLAVLIRRLLKLDKLKLRSTWWETAEAHPAGAEPRARQFAAGVDGTDWHPSFDLYGGGGLVMSARDLATFAAALFEGRIFKRRETLGQMLWQGPHRGGDYYRLGLFADKVGDHYYYWHGGFWGTFIYYAPHRRVAAAGVTTRQTGFGRLKQIVGEAAGIPPSKVPPLKLAL